MNKYKEIKILGRGGFGEAILVERRSDKVKFVIKNILLNGLKPNEIAFAKKEVEILKALDSPFIVKYIESFECNGKLCIVMEYADGGDLSMKIAQRGRKYFQEDEIMHYFIQIAFALNHVHNRKTIHRDIKGQNIFLCKDGSIKLGDFGIARVLDSTNQLCQTRAGTYNYMSPEVLGGMKYNSKADIWSLGCVLYELCTLKRAFDARNIPKLIESIIRGEYKPIPTHFSANVKNLIDRMLKVDPEDRPSIDQIIMIPFIMDKSRYLMKKVASEMFKHAKGDDGLDAYEVKDKGIVKISPHYLYELTLLLKQHAAVSLCYCFKGCERLEHIAFPPEFNTSNVTDMSGMFGGCSSLSSLNLSTFNTGSVTNMRCMFYGCNSLISLDLSTFNTRSVTNMGSMFSGCSGLRSLDLSTFDTSSVQYMGLMFHECRALTSLNLSTFKTSNVTIMGSMFSGCDSLISLNLSTFNTSSVQHMGGMFWGCISLSSLDLSTFNTSNVTSMDSMFRGCSGLSSLDLSTFNTSSVTNMNSMFSGCSNLSSLDLSTFNTSRVTNMCYMFYVCNSLYTLDLSSFDTSSVGPDDDYSGCTGMFKGCDSLGNVKYNKNDLRIKKVLPIDTTCEI